MNPEKPLPSVPLQRLSDCGLNPFAAQLLIESWLRHPSPQPVSFVLNGVLVTLQAATEEAVRQFLKDCRIDGGARADIAKDLPTDGRT